MAERIRIAVIGSGVAGSLLVAGLKDDPRFEVICLERAAVDEYEGGGTGLNVGPNAIKTLQAFEPATAARLQEVSIPWERWHVALTNGRVLLDYSIYDVADNAGIRIRWAELYRQLRTPVIDAVTFGVTVETMGYVGPQAFVIYRDAAGNEHRLEHIDLVLGADGRFSKVRETFFDPPPSRQAGMGICRLLSEPDGRPHPIPEYGQWFNGPYRLLGFALPGGATYATATFPIEIGAQIPEELKIIRNLRSYFEPTEGSLCPESAYILECLERDESKLHWARFQESDFLWEDVREQALLVGDSCHAMLPTLGQGATQAIEDACVAADTLKLHADPTNPKESIARALRHYRRRREARVLFTAQFTNEASDTLMPGCDDVNDTLRKARRPFTDNMKRLYRDTPVPLAKP